MNPPPRGPRLSADDEQGGDFFHRAVAVLLLYLEHVNACGYRCVMFHVGTASHFVHCDILANQR